MKVYHYDSITKEYSGISDARLDPLETKKQGKEIYLLPASATFDTPSKVSSNQVAIWQDKKWKTVDIPPIIEEEPPVETPEELAKKETEILIQTKIREIAVTALKAEGKM